MLRSFRSRISMTYFLLTIVIFLVLFFSLFWTLYQNQHDTFREDLKKTAQLAAGYVNGEEVLQVPLSADCAKNPAHQSLVRNLKKITATDSRIFDAYIMIPSGRPGTYLFVANAKEQLSPVACGEPYDASKLPELAQALVKPGVDREPSKDKWGSWISAYAPIADHTGKHVAVLGVDVAETTYAGLGKQFILHLLAAMVAAAFLAMFVGLASSRWLTAPMEKIIHGMERVRKGDLEYRLELFPEREFNRIVSIFNSMTVSLKTIMRQLAVTVKERERVNRELEIAAELQKKALPTIPTEQKEVEIAADSVPAKEVGGDYFDFLLNHPDRIGFVIADAAGKGFPGSLYMTNSRSVFRVVSDEGRVPADTLRRTNEFISADKASNEGMFITFLYSVFEKATKRFTYANAGHYPPLVYSPSQRLFKNLGAGGIPLGVYAHQEFPQETIQLQSEDVVVMYTDGVLEASNKEGQMFGLARLVTLVERHAGRRPVEILELIKKAVKDFIDPEPPFDDLTLVIFKVK